MDELWVKILFWAITGILGFAATWFAAQVRNYKRLLNEDRDEHTIELIDSRLDEKLAPIKADIDALKDIDQRIDLSLEPIREELVQMHKNIEETMKDEEDLKGSLMSSYKFRLIQLCQRYVRQGYITTNQYTQLLEFYKVYVAFGGNGQGKTWYDKAIALEIKDPEEVDSIEE